MDRAGAPAVRRARAPLAWSTRLVALLVALAACSRSTASTTAPAADPRATLSSSPGVAMPTARPPGARGITRVVPQADQDVVSVIRTERLAAKSQGRVLVVYVGASWCEPCRAFRAALEAGTLDARLAGLTLLELDVDRDADRIATAGYTSKYVPFFALPNADGSPSTTRLEYAGKGSGAVDAIAAGLARWLSGDAPHP